MKRFVFISSIGVNGAQSVLGNPFSDTDKPNPHTAYSISLNGKLNKVCCILLKEPGWRWSLFVPRWYMGQMRREILVLWYAGFGAACPCHWALFTTAVAWWRWIDRDLHYDHPAAANRAFLVSDGEDLSTTQLLQRLGLALGKPARLVPVPHCSNWVLRWWATCDCAALMRVFAG